MPDRRSSSPTHARSLLKDVFKARKLFPLLSATFCFALFLLAFILIPYFQQTPKFLKDELTLLSVFHDKFARADFSSYSFQSGLGISLSRLMLTGSGGILSLIGSLLPTTIHPQTVLFLSAFRLGLCAFFFSALQLKYAKKPSFLRIFGMSFLYALGAFSLSFLLHLPITETYAILPIILLLFTDIFFRRRPVISPGLFIAICCYFLSNLPLSLLLLPVLLITAFCLGRHKCKDNFRKLSVRLLAQSILAIGLCGFFLVPQIYKIDTLFRKSDPTARFLQNIGSDNPSKSTEITFSCEATSILLEHPAALFAASSGSSGFDFAAQRENHFQLFNDWIYSLWPSLPAKPFRNISSDLPKPTYTDSQNVEFRITTLFLDPLYVTVDLPHLREDVQVFLNNNPIQIIRNNPKSVMVNLGSYNVGQALTLRLTSSDPDSIRDAKICYGYFSGYDWSKYTDSSNFGITRKELRSDGISAEMTVSEESLLLTNIPFEEGWELYLNGQRTPLLSYEDAFLSATVAPGNHVLFLRYSPPGLVIGSILSGVSMLLLAAYYFSKSSPKKSQRSESRNK